MRMTQSEGSEFATPDSTAWRQAQEYKLELTPAPPVHASVNLRFDASTPPVPVHMRAASDGERMYIRLRWKDASENRLTSRSEFSDAVAVQFALQDMSSTSYMMGAPTAPVNIWYWRGGDDSAQNLAAGGFGSTTTLDSTGLIVESEYRKQGEWLVVFSRPMASTEEHQVNLDGADQIAVALAVWQGETEQRDGLKHVTQGWINIDRSSD